jgi:hypothetical protein
MVWLLMLLVVIALRLVRYAALKVDVHTSLILLRIVL